MERRIKDFIYYISMEYSPEWIVKQMELTEGEATELAIKVSSYMDGLQLEAARYERIKRFN
ncbi:hypothetical protein H5123_09220 [Shewanella sp. SR43-4]|jgi:hypothetical protein|uniref:hypothetical protein n=1 Tax=Shewanella sp. SR43-4 TaxID=2760942 RepID=UPI0015FD964D|nr:hypothetical protein [Shewanella sp. SR43-4]MBB1317821.1 hypothetical protein [Shewanella sp. SR43-4]